LHKESFLLKIVSLLSLLITVSFAEVYYAKVEPYEVRTIASFVSGQVVYADENMLGKRLSKRAFIQIDDRLNRDELASVRKKMGYLKDTLSVDEKIIKNLKEVLIRKKENFKRIASLSIKSKEKDREFYNVVASENSYLATLKEMNSLKTNISDLALKEKQLLKTIQDKSIVADGFVLYALKVKPESVVNIGTPLAVVADISKAIAVVYLNESDLINLNKRVLYINGKKSDYKFTRISKIADSQNISRYRAEIIMKAPKIFSNLIKIELKEKHNESK